MTVAEPAARRCALVTGASRSIGAAIAGALAEDGWTVGVNYRVDADGARAVAAAIAERGGRALPAQADVADQAAVERMFATLEEQAGPVLAVVNNAGFGRVALLPASDVADWRRVLDVNLTGAYLTTRRALPAMLRGRFGRIVNIVSAAAQRAIPGQAGYAASKAGVEALTRTTAVEVARRGITANAVAPGWIDTELSREAAVRLDAIPARRLGSPAEVAACVRWLVSGAATYVTGTTIAVDGGVSASLGVV